MKILHVITGLQCGGAENQLARLLAYNPKDTGVFVIGATGEIAAEIASLGVPIFYGGADSKISLKWYLQLRGLVKQNRPSILCGWMYHGNLAASLSVFGLLKLPVIWNIRHSISDLNYEKLSTRWVIRAGAFLSKKPVRIVYNSLTAAKQHESLGYNASARVIIPNGFDVERFKPDFECRKLVRQELNISDNETLVGVVGRSHPMKNHTGFVKAIASIISEVNGLRVVMVGRGINEPESGIPALIKDLNISHRIQMLPETSQPERLYSALDLLVSPSQWGEAFPNVVGEAMSCGVPCMVTDVGDSAAVVGDAGYVVPSGQVEHLATGLKSVLADKTILLEKGRKARERIVEFYTTNRVFAQYHTLFGRYLY